MRPTVLLFDIDGTLLHTRGAGRRAMETAFWRRHGRRDALGFRFDGMTDRLILKTALDGLGLRYDAQALEAELDALVDLYIEALADEAARATNFEVCPGVTEILDRCAARPGVVMGLGTGNVVRGAEIKLGRVGLHGRFAFGGYGCDSIDRATLIGMGAARGAARAGAALEDCRVVIIGDTPRDIAAARTIGAECVSVATGAFTVEALRAAGGTVVLPDLTHPEAERWICEGAG